MARPIWKGHLSFGLVNIPVTLYSAEARTDLHFKLIDSRNHAGIRYERVNEVTGEEVPWGEIVKAYEHDEGEFVLLSDEDFKRAAPAATETVEIEDFVPEEQVAPEYFEKPYFLVPTKKGQKSYALLRETMRRTGKIAIARVVIRTREYLGAVLVRGRGLMLNLLRFEQELKPMPLDSLPPLDLDEAKVSDRELAMAEQLVESMTGDWQPQKYEDEYRKALLAYIDEKLVKGDTANVQHHERDEVEEDSSNPANTIDIVELLKRSMASRQEGDAESPPRRKRGRG